MGSVCCTSSRVPDIPESGEDWAMEQSGHANNTPIHGTLSPPPLSSRWDRRPHFSELAASYNGMLIHRTASSSSRSYRSNSNSSESYATGSHRPSETADGLLAVLNSPSESFRYSHQLPDNIVDPATISSDTVWRKSTPHLSQKDSGLPASPLPFAKAIDSHAKGYMNEFTSTRLHPYQQMLKNSLDGPLTVPRQKSGSQKSCSFPELVDSPHPSSSRWFNMDIFSNNVTDGEQDLLDEFYIKSTSASHDPIAPQVESPKCELCTKEISQKPFWSFPRALGSKELPVVGILECGHVYHAECLDQATPTTQAHDPPCPRCVNQKSTRTKVLEESASKSRMRELSFLKGKTSRIGISMEDSSSGEPTKSFQPVQYQYGVSESSSRKGCLQTAPIADKSLSTKSILRKQFSLRGKVSRDAISSGFGPKRPGYAARVLPENSTRDYNFYVGEKLSYV